MNTCYVCYAGAQHEHHVVPQSVPGGSQGPTVHLCAACHQAVHNGAHALKRGKSADEHFAHLPVEARERGTALSRIVVAAELTRDEEGNRSPLLTVKLEDPTYMKALDMLKRDRGFSSRAALVNAIFREIARGYGLLGGSLPKS